jgi:hypothetical protein
MKTMTRTASFAHDARAIIIAVLTFLLYSSALTFGFVNLG